MFFFFFYYELKTSAIDFSTFVRIINLTNAFFETQQKNSQLEKLTMRKTFGEKRIKRTFSNFKSNFSTIFRSNLITTAYFEVFRGVVWLSQSSQNRLLCLFNGEFLIVWSLHFFAVTAYHFTKLYRHFWKKNLNLF